LLGEARELGLLGLVEEGAAELGVLLGLLLLPLEVGGLVLLLEAEVTDHHVVEGAHGLAEAERVAELGVEEDPGSRQVGREADGGAGAGGLYLAGAEVAQVEVHDAASTEGFSSGRVRAMAPPSEGSRKAARATAASAVRRSGARTLRRAMPRSGS